MKRSSLALIATCLAWSARATAQCSDALPPWLAHELVGKILADAASTYFVGRGVEQTASGSQAMAREDALGQIARCNFVRIQATQELARDTTIRSNTGNAETSTEAHSRVTTSAATGVKGMREVASLACRGSDGVRTTLVVTVPRASLPSGCSAELDLPSSTDFLWRSALVPGWGQMHKGETTLGVLLLVVEAVAIPVAIVTGVASRSERDKASAAHVQSERNAYNERADRLYYGSVASGVAAAGVYVFNLVNAGVSTPDYGLVEGDDVGIAAPAEMVRLGWSW